jgi:protein-disulfide isomerase
MELKYKVNLALFLGALGVLLGIIALSGNTGSAPVTGPDAFYLAQAREAGIKKRAFEQCIASPEVQARIDAEVTEVNGIGGTGTPYNVIATPDGLLIPLPGAYPFAAFADIIDRALAGELTEEEIANAARIDDIRPFDPEVDYFKGPADAEITIYEWSDYECPFCSRVHPSLQQVVDTYPNVNWVYRNLPLSFHVQAEPAARAALCIGQEKGNEAFWNFTDTLFEDQSVLQG